MEATLDNQLPTTGHGTTGTQLGEEESGHVLLGPLHALADLGDVGKDGLLVSLAHALRRWDLVALLSSGSMLGVLLGEEVEEATL